MLSLRLSGGLKALLPRSGYTRVVARGEISSGSPAPDPAQQKHKLFPHWVSSMQGFSMPGCMP